MDSVLRTALLLVVAVGSGVGQDVSPPTPLKGEATGQTIDNDMPEQRLISGRDYDRLPITLRAFPMYPIQVLPPCNGETAASRQSDAQLAVSVGTKGVLWDIPERFSIASDAVCGTLADAQGRPVMNTLLELKPVRYTFGQPHASMVQIRVGRTLKHGTTGRDGQFDLRGVKPGTYKIRIASSKDGVWEELNILRPVASHNCPLRLVLDVERKSVALSKQ